MIVIISGVSGSGKSTVGRRLAERLDWRFYDADDFHSQANVEKMSRGEPLTDSDRKPWLQAMAKAIRHWSDKDESAVLACSALKDTYRDTLMKASPDTRLIYLKVPLEAVRQRMKQRHGHFMKASMLESQFEALEEPTDTKTLVVDGTLPISEIVLHLSAVLKQ